LREEVAKLGECDEQSEGCFSGKDNKLKRYERRMRSERRQEWVKYFGEKWRVVWSSNGVEFEDA
jgi:hypothetical protein